MAEIDYSKFKVLVVDDVPLNVLLVTKMISKYPLNVISAYNGESALKVIEGEKPDIVLLDLMMPGIDGFEVLERVRKNPEYNNMRIIILSALNSEADIERGFKGGANDFVTKPIIMERLLTAVNNQLAEIS